MLRVLSVFFFTLVRFLRLASKNKFYSLRIFYGTEYNNFLIFRLLSKNCSKNNESSFSFSFPISVELIISKNKETIVQSSIF